MDRGPYWWERVTRAEQDRIAYQHSDSIESLARGLQAADEEETDLYFRVSVTPVVADSEKLLLTTGATVRHPCRGQKKIC